MLLARVCVGRDPGPLSADVHHRGRARPAARRLGRFPYAALSESFAGQAQDLEGSDAWVYEHGRGERGGGRGAGVDRGNVA